MKKYPNSDVYKFLTEECRIDGRFGEKFGERIVNRKSDVSILENLGEELECFSICGECGNPMIKGYLVDGCDCYCSADCLHKHLTDEEFNELYDDGNGNTYWTTWFEEFETYKNKH